MDQLKEKIDQLIFENETLDKDVREQSDKAKRLAELNEELRDLIHQERNAYNEEKLRFDEEIEAARRHSEQKFKITKNKLIMVL